MEASKFVIGAVLAQQESKRSLLSEKQRILDEARRVLGAAQSDVDDLRHELDELQKFLVKAGAATQGKQSLESMSGIESQPAVKRLLSGRDIRPVVLECADEAFREKVYFSIDDVMAILNARNYTLDVESPRTRTSQILTLTAEYGYDGARKAWTKKSSNPKY